MCRCIHNYCLTNSFFLSSCVLVHCCICLSFASISLSLTNSWSSHLKNISSYISARVYLGLLLSLSLSLFFLLFPFSLPPSPPSLSPLFSFPPSPSYPSYPKYPLSLSHLLLTYSSASYSSLSAAASSLFSALVQKFVDSMMPQHHGPSSTREKRIDTKKP